MFGTKAAIEAMDNKALHVDAGVATRLLHGIFDRINEVRG
jgi:hypothetical protein